jgi:hypothetical protein
MGAKTRRKRSRTESSTGRKAEQARKALVTLAVEKLGRPLTQAELEEIRHLDGSYLVSGYYAELYQRYSPDDLLGWFSSVAETRKKLEEIQRRRDAITASQMQQACAEVAQIAEEKIGRGLTEAERKVIRGFDKSLLAGGDIACLYREYSAQQILDNFAECGAGPGPVALLEALSTGRYSLKAGQERILKCLSPKGRAALAGFEFGAVLEDFSRWLLNLLRADPPGREISGLYFGLFESEGGCKLYVSGGKAYDVEDSDWACAMDWSPEGRYARLEQFSKLWRPLREAGDEPWVVIQAMVIVLVRSFFGNHCSEFRKLTGLRRVHVASGFDDGDLYAIHTPLSPRA